MTKTNFTRNRRKLNLKKNPLLLIGITLVSIIIIFTITVPFVSPYNWLDRDGTQRFIAPSSEHLFGTNEWGQDLFLGIWKGGRISLLVAVLGVLPYTLFGAFMGIIGGHSNNRIGFIISQLMTFIYAMPLLPLILLLRFPLGYIGLSETQIVYASIGIYSFFSAPTLYKIVKAETLRIKSEEYMKAAEIMGISRYHQIVHHLLPNLAGQIIVAMIQFMTQLIILELVLYFFGVYLQPEEGPTWGSLIPNISGPNTFKEYYWIWLFPMIVVSLTTIGLKFISEGLRIEFDPKAAQS